MGIAGGVGRPTGLLCAVAMLLAACGGKTTQQDVAVVARVNGHELTTADLIDSIEPPGTPTHLAQPTRAVVDALIDEHLMAQQALAAGLEGDPVVSQALQNARRHILAEAFVSRLQGTRTPPPTPAAIEEYYRSNPALFGARRVYSLTIFTVKSAALSDGLLAAIGHTSSGSALAQVLEQHSVQFEVQQLQRAAEELPTSQLPQYSAASIGDVLVAADDYGTTRLIQIAGIKSHPSSLEEARPTIERDLAQLDRTAAVDAFLARARSQAQITYSIPGRLTAVN
jgi:EpsD family peptidyl-prolyl cis-trans isomerase